MVELRILEQATKCGCGAQTHREMVWSFNGDEKQYVIPFCENCEEGLRNYLQLKEQQAEATKE